MSEYVFVPGCGGHNIYSMNVVKHSFREGRIENQCVLDFVVGITGETFIHVHNAVLMMFPMCFKFFVLHILKTGNILKYSACIVKSLKIQ